MKRNTHPAVSKTLLSCVRVVPTADFYSGLQNPPDLASWRERRFRVDAPIILHAAQFALYWPYVSNVWCKDNTRSWKSDNAEVTHYDCLRRLEKEIKDVEGGCDTPGAAVHYSAAMRVEYHPNSGIYALQRVIGDQGHSHSLRHSDQVKKNDALRARVEHLFTVNPGITGAKILISLRGVEIDAVEDRAMQLEAAGGRHLTAKDCSNWGRHHRALQLAPAAQSNPRRPPPMKKKRNSTSQVVDK